MNEGNSESKMTTNPGDMLTKLHNHNIATFLATIGKSSSQSIPFWCIIGSLLYEHNSLLHMRSLLSFTDSMWSIHCVFLTKPLVFGRPCPHVVISIHRQGHCSDYHIQFTKDSINVRALWRLGVNNGAASKFDSLVYRTKHCYNFLHPLSPQAIISLPWCSFSQLCDSWRCHEPIGVRGEVFKV